MCVAEGTHLQKRQGKRGFSCPLPPPPATAFPVSEEASNRVTACTRARPAQLGDTAPAWHHVAASLVDPVYIYIYIYIYIGTSFILQYRNFTTTAVPIALWARSLIPTLRLSVISLLTLLYCNFLLLAGRYGLSTGASACELCPSGEIVVVVKLHMS